MERETTNTNANTNAPASRRTNVSVDDIRQKAYQIYLSRGSKPGNQMQDWLQAKKELGVKDNI
jgi:hypothetical protein